MGVEPVLGHQTIHGGAVALEQVALEVALQELPEAFRTVFLLRDGEGLSYEEIAEVLDISPKTVSSRLHRARQPSRQSS